MRRKVEGICINVCDPHCADAFKAAVRSGLLHSDSVLKPEVAALVGNARQCVNCGKLLRSNRGGKREKKAINVTVESAHIDVRLSGVDMHELKRRALAVVNLTGFEPKIRIYGQFKRRCNPFGLPGREYDLIQLPPPAWYNVTELTRRIWLEIHAEGHSVLVRLSDAQAVSLFV